MAPEAGGEACTVLLSGATLRGCSAVGLEKLSHRLDTGVTGGEELGRTVCTWATR